MTRTEKESLLSTFSLPARWCKDMEACDDQGEAVAYNHPTAVAWDLTGGLCRLFGWDRALELFPQLARSMLGMRSVARRSGFEVACMVALQEFNDHPETTHGLLLARLHSLPVWSGGPTRKPPAAASAQSLSRGDQ